MSEQTGEELKQRTIVTAAKVLRTYGKVVRARSRRHIWECVDNSHDAMYWTSPDGKLQFISNPTIEIVIFDGGYAVIDNGFGMSRGITLEDEPLRRAYIEAQHAPVPTNIDIFQMSYLSLESLEFAAQFPNLSPKSRKQRSVVRTIGRFAMGWRAYSGVANRCRVYSKPHAGKFGGAFYSASERMNRPTSYIELPTAQAIDEGDDRFSGPHDSPEILRNSSGEPLPHGTMVFVTELFDGVQEDLEPEDIAIELGRDYAGFLTGENAIRITVVDQRERTLERNHQQPKRHQVEPAEYPGSFLGEWKVKVRRHNTGTLRLWFYPDAEHGVHFRIMGKSRRAISRWPNLRGSVFTRGVAGYFELDGVPDTTFPLDDDKNPIPSKFFKDVQTALRLVASENVEAALVKARQLEKLERVADTCDDLAEITLQTIAATTVFRRVLGFGGARIPEPKRRGPREAPKDTLTVIITDVNGEGVPGITVQVTGSGISMQFITKESGRVRFADLPIAAGDKGTLYHINVLLPNQWNADLQDRALPAEERRVPVRLTDRQPGRDVTIRLNVGMKLESKVSLDQIDQLTIDPAPLPDPTEDYDCTALRQTHRLVINTLGDRLRALPVDDPQAERAFIAELVRDAFIEATLIEQPELMATHLSLLMREARMLHQALLEAGNL